MCKVGFIEIAYMLILFVILKYIFMYVVSREDYNHGRRNFKDTNPLMSSSLVIFVRGGEAIL